MPCIFQCLEMNRAYLPCQYLNFDSHHPTCHKAAVVSTLLKRVERLCSSMALRLEEQHVFKALKSNGYPEHFIRKLYHRRPLLQQDVPEPTAVLVLPYIHGVSDSIKMILFHELVSRQLLDLLDPQATLVPS